MNHTATEIESMHRTLYRMCGLEELPIMMADTTRWRDFLFGLSALDQSEGGRFTCSDLIAVLTVMQKQKREGIAWSMRPTQILANPERFLDMVLAARAELKIKARKDSRPKPVAFEQHLPNGTNRITDDNQPEPEAAEARTEAAETFRRMREQAGHRAPNP